jgi:hypothetical protein
MMIPSDQHRKEIVTQAFEDRLRRVRLFLGQKAFRKSPSMVSLRNAPEKPMQACIGSGW